MRNSRMKYATAFISSTFADMKSERDLIMYNVYPRVKQWAFERGIIFDIVDLRWGINEDQAQNIHHTIKICLQRVKECDPLFVCLLGERYGWIPDVQDFNQDMFDKDITQYIGASATELEIMQALDNAFFDSSEKACVFLFRNELCFDGVDKNVVDTYIDTTNKDRLQSLKKKIEEDNSVIKYSAEFENESGNAELAHFRTDDTSLEDALTEKLINILSEKYNISDDDRLVREDLLVHQQFYLKHLSLIPKIDGCVSRMHKYLDESIEHSITCVCLNSKHALEHQVAHFIVDKQDNAKTIYRFMGIDHNINNENDLIMSIAYEISGDDGCLEDFVRASLFLKDWLEKTNEQITLVVAGIDEREYVGYVNLIRGFKFFKTLFFVNIKHKNCDKYIEYSKDDFILLAKNMLHTKAKTLLPNQLNALMEFADSDYDLLRTTVNYLCTFASYENVDSMILELNECNKTSLTKKFLERMFDVQNSHSVDGIMKSVIELLCYTPLPLTRKDIIDTIELSRHRESIPVEKIAKEVDFSLCFAKDFIEEYNSRYIINDKTVKEVFGVHLTEIVNTSSLIVYLFGTYFARLMDLDESFDLIDGKNFCQILKFGLLNTQRKQFENFILGDYRVLYRLTKTVTKRDIIELFKALSIQELGYSTKFNLPDDMSLPDEMALKLKQSNAIATEKLFAIFRKQGANNIFLTYYTMMFSLTKKDLENENSFREFIETHLDAKDVVYHKIQLPDTFKITATNSELYTIFDAKNDAYQTYFGVCNNGFFFVLDAFTGDLVTAFAVPWDQGEPVSVFYSDHKMHILFEKGVVAVINLDQKIVQFFRFEDESSQITAFNNYYFKGFNVMVQNERTVKLLRGLSSQVPITFADTLKIKSAFLTFTKSDEVDKMIVVGHNIEGEAKFYLIDPYVRKIIDAFALYDSVTFLSQDHSNGDVYFETASCETFSLWCTEEDKLSFDYTEAKCHYVHNCRGLTSEKDVGIFYNEELIADENVNIVSSFGTRKVIGFVTDDNVLYCIDNGY